MRGHNEWAQLQPSHISADHNATRSSYIDRLAVFIRARLTQYPLASKSIFPRVEIIAEAVVRHDCGVQHGSLVGVLGLVLIGSMLFGACRSTGQGQAYR